MDGWSAGSDGRGIGEVCGGWKEVWDGIGRMDGCSNAVKRGVSNADKLGWTVWTRDGWRERERGWMRWDGGGMGLDGWTGWSADG